MFRSLFGHLVLVLPTIIILGCKSKSPVVEFTPSRLGVECTATPYKARSPSVVFTDQPEKLIETWTKEGWFLFGELVVSSACPLDEDFFKNQARKLQCDRVGYTLLHYALEDNELSRDTLTVTKTLSEVPGSVKIDGQRYAVKEYSYKTEIGRETKLKTREQHLYKALLFRKR